MRTYTKKELQEIANSYADVDICKYNGKRKTLHYDFIQCTYLKIEDLPEQIECEWTYVDEDDYENLYGCSIDFSETYENKDAKVMVILLPWYTQIQS